MVIGEILKLDKHFRPAFGDCIDKFFNHSVKFFAHQPVIPFPQIENIVLQIFIVGSHIQHNRQCFAGINPRTSHVERQLTYGNTHTIAAQIT